MAAKVDKGLQRAMSESLKAYAAGDKRFFNYLRDNVRVYGLESLEPTTSRGAFEASFGPNLVKTRRKVSVLKSDIQTGDNTAVLAQTLQITANGVTSNVRQTVVWEKDKAQKWRMSHIHNALVGQPIAAGAPPKTAAAVRVLNERIATVAATVGVAQ